MSVIDPFEIFAQLLGMAITTPWLHNLNSWLVRAEGVRLGHPLKVPRGDWILCGYGRMGRWFHKYMTKQGIQSIVIDPDIDIDGSTGGDKIIRAYADRKTLKEAGIEHAAGIVAGTANDADNLGILLSAEALNPDAFTIVRQNDHDNQLAFDAANVDLTLQSSLTTARRILKFLISPLIQTLIDYLQSQHQAQAEDLIKRLKENVGDQRPHLWRVNLCPKEAMAVTNYLNEHKLLSLTDLIRDPQDRSRSLNCVPLMIQRDEKCIMLPAHQHGIKVGDEIVLCGTERSERLLAATLNNPYTLHFLTTGTDMPRGYFFNWLNRRKLAATSAA